MTAPANNSDTTPGAALAAAARRKRRRYPELASGRFARFLVLGCETGGRWSDDAVAILPALAHARALSVPKILRKALRSTLVARWSAIIAVAAQRAFCSTLSGSVSPFLLPHGEPSLLPSTAFIDSEPMPPTISRLPAS